MNSFTTSSHKAYEGAAILLSIVQGEIEEQRVS